MDKVPNLLLSAVHALCSRYGYDKTYWIAYSGGLDSHVLLALCKEVQKSDSVSFRAIHINHNISFHAKVWAKHCERICRAFDIDFIERSIELSQTEGESLEEVARKERY